jgi:osmoprotectant transport system ATP-binding protein
MLLDEPFGALDPITRREIQQEFHSLQKRLAKTMVFVTHDVREAFLLASRIGLLKEGKLILLGPPAELLKSQEPEVRAFVDCLGDSTAPVSAR